MNSIFWAGIALLALAGWAVTLAILTRAFVPMANTLSILHKVDKLIDDRIATVVQRIRDRQDRGMSKAQNVPRGTESDARDAANDALRQVFGGAPLEGIPEQPDSDLEVVS